MNILFLVAAFGLGLLVSAQPPINAQVAAVLGSPLLAAAFSIATSLVLIAAAWFALDAAAFDWRRFADLPWQALIGGAAGALFVIGALLVAPKVGVAAFFVFVVLGQLTGATLIDQFGVFGAAANPVSLSRLAGVALVFAGAALTQWRF